MDVAEWLVFRGTRALIVFTEEDDVDDLKNIHTSRFNRLINRYKSTFCLLPKTRLLSQESAVQVVEEVMKFGQTSHIFCINEVLKCLYLANVYPEIL